MNEAETRAEHIDPALKAGWGVVEGSRVRREFHINLGRPEGYGRRAKAEIADYVLVYRNHTLAVIEVSGLNGGCEPLRFNLAACPVFCKPVRQRA